LGEIFTHIIRLKKELWKPVDSLHFLIIIFGCRKINLYAP